MCDAQNPTLGIPESSTLDTLQSCSILWAHHFQAITFVARSVISQDHDLRDLPNLHVESLAQFLWPPYGSY